jgi:hypothetical protein
MLTMSIVGLYRYDNTIFDGLILPEGMTKDILVPNLLIELAELEIRFPRPDTIKEAITAWGSRRLPIWQKLYNTTQITYDPIYNKDAYYTDTETRNLAHGHTKTNTGESEANTSGTSTDKVTSFNANTFQNSAQTETSGSSSGEYSDQESLSGTDTGTITHMRREYGNIGVTTTQQMLEAERDVVQFDMYEYIIADFKERFCIMIY